MEEKERYELTDTDCILDTERNIVVSDVVDVITNADIITDLLNQQDKRIKELEQENRDLEDDHNKLIDQYDKQYNGLCKEIQFHSSARERFVKKVKELKQQLHDLPKKIVEEIRDCVSKRIMEKQIKWGDNIQIGFICNAINECLDTILEKFGGKDEINND